MKNNNAVGGAGLLPAIRGSVANVVRRAALPLSIAATAGVSLADAGSGNTGADAVLAQMQTLVAVAAAVVAGAILIVIVPWGAKMAVKVYKAIVG